MADIDPTEGLPSAAQQAAEEEELRELEARSGGLTPAELERRAELTLRRAERMRVAAYLLGEEV